MSGIDEHAGTCTDEHVWCTCGWIAAVPYTPKTWPPKVAAELWGDHAEIAHPVED